MVPWWLLPIAVFVSAGITLVAYAVVVVGAESERSAIPVDEIVRDEGCEVIE